MTFQHSSYLMILLPWAAFTAYLLYREWSDRRSVAEFMSELMMEKLRSGQGRRSRLLTLALRCLGIGFFVLAIAGPQWGTEMVPVEHEAADVVFAVDCSRSMQAKDLTPSRQEVSRDELSTLMSELQGHRLGLVGFAGSAYILSPLTMDVSATQLFLEQLHHNSLPIQGTSLSEAIRTSLSLLSNEESSKSIVLLTDGEDPDSGALEMARMAAKQGVVIHTLGVGSVDGAVIPDPEEGTVKDRNGEAVVSRLEEKTLKEIAELTGGTYTRLSGSSSDVGTLAGVLSQADGDTLQLGSQEKPILRFQWLLCFGLFLLILAQVIQRKEKTL